MSVASPIQRTPLDRLQGNWNLDDSPGALWADLIQRTLSPWQRNPLKFDPLRELLRRHFDEKAVRACHEIKAFIAATNVQTGKDQFSAAGSCRSTRCSPPRPACRMLPRGRDRRRALLGWRLPRQSADLAVLYNVERPTSSGEINRHHAERNPDHAADIANRLNEITFGGALMSEMRAIAFVQDLIEKGAITGEFGGRLKRMLIHSIADPASLAPLGAVSKFNIEPEFLKHLFGLGRGRLFVAGRVVHSVRHQEHHRHRGALSVE